MPPLLQLQKLPGKGDGGWKKKCLCFIFWLTRRLWVHEKKCVLGHAIAWATSHCLLPNTFWLRASKNVFKIASVKFTNSLSPPSIVKKVYAPEVKAAKGLKRCWAKVKGVNNPTWTAKYSLPFNQHRYIYVQPTLRQTAAYLVRFAWLVILQMDKNAFKMSVKLVASHTTTKKWQQVNKIYVSYISTHTHTWKGEKGEKKESNKHAVDTLDSHLQ